MPNDSAETFPSKMIDQGQQTSEHAYQAADNQSYLPEQSSKTIAMPPIGALFKPIDQLEAFVQNVSSQVESSTSSSISGTGIEGRVEESKKRSSSNDSVDSPMLLDDTQQQSLSSSAGSIDDEDEYSGISPAKKRKVDLVSQEAVISSSNVCDTDPQQQQPLAHQHDHSASGDDSSSSDMDTEALPTVSSQASSNCATEEPSSSTTTNEVKSDDDEEEEEDDDTGNAAERLVGPAGAQLSMAMAGPAEGDKCATADAGNSHGEVVVVEAADQSNCVDEEDDDDEAGQEANKDESLSSSCDKEANSIDEETGEHV